MSVAITICARRPSTQVQVARAHFQPLAELGHEDFVVGRSARAVSVSMGRPAKAVHVVQRLRRAQGDGGHARLRDHAQVPHGVRAEPQAVQLVGEQQFARCRCGATDTAASSASSTVVKRSYEADSCSRMRVGSVMSVIEVIQPVWWPRARRSAATHTAAR